MIVSFADQTTEDIYHGRGTRNARRVPQMIWSIAARKLDMLNAAKELIDLRSPPGNRLEKLRGRLEGKYSIRINDQFRIVFIFKTGSAHKVQITDYH